MTQGKILAPHGSRSLEKRVITISRPQRPDTAAESDEPLVVNVIRRRWMLLATCCLLSAIAAGLTASQFTLPKATTAGKLRYVQLPPALKEVYRAPATLEFAEILRSFESMAELGRRTGVQMDARTLSKRFAITASRYSNIIDIELRWRDGEQSIAMVNELMRIAGETTASNRKQTLQQYGIETEVQLEDANQRVLAMREKALELQQQRNSQLSDSGQLGAEANVLMGQIDRTEELLDGLTLKRVALNRQLTTLRSDVNELRRLARNELFQGRREQIETRMRLYNPNSQRYELLRRVSQQLGDFETSGAELDYSTWRTKLESIGKDLVGALDPSSLLAVEAMERKLNLKDTKIEQIELELLPIDGELSLLENRRESQERRLADFTGSADISSSGLEEAETQLKVAIDARTRLRNQLDNIRRGEETDFNEMTVLTPASWQTTEASEGRGKLFAFTFAGCFMALVLPVFALEHFFPSGDPAEKAAKSLGLPRISQGTFISNRASKDRRHLHPVNTEAMRLLALRIQQSVHGPGAMVLFSGLNHAKSAIPMISYLAECLSRREEKVLIVDACERSDEAQNDLGNDESVADVMVRNGSPRVTSPADGNGKANGEKLPANLDGSAAGVVGLADFLRRRDIGADEMICTTSIPGVDIIPSGSGAFPREGLAASCLTTLFEECRQRYTMILVAGPSTQHPSDLQMMSARADAIFFTVPPNGRPAGEGETVIRDLLDLGAPVVGIVS